jgi:hypothetical protein
MEYSLLTMAAVQAHLKLLATSWKSSSKRNDTARQN